MKAIRRNINPATILALVALVFAVTGGAYAASSGSGSGSGNGGGHATASVAKAKKKKAPAGKPGPRGPAGPAGAAGPAGPAGPGGAKGENGAAGTNGTDGTNGEKGETGAKGANGTNGTNGASATTASFSGKEHGCESGGTEVKSGSAPTYVCNGQTGYTETLPAGKTETGTWDSSTTTPTTLPIPIAIPFAIPLAVPSEHVEFLDAEQTENSVGSGKCEFEVAEPEATPVAPEGYLCVFTRLEEGSGEFVRIGLNTFITGDSPAGTYVWLKTPAAGEYVGFMGVWAVTAS